jgi:RimJ/RimL family protein N-acetyltransferase
LDLEDDHWRREFRIDLETPRFLLRPLIAEDLEWLTVLLADADVNRFIWDGALPPEKARRAAQAIVDLDRFHVHFGLWAIQDKSNGAIHGYTELGKLRPWSGPSDEIALSYVLRRASWGHGIATEAAGRLLRYAFEVHSLDRVMAVTKAGNTASQRVLEKLGLRWILTDRSVRSSDPLEYFQIDAPTPASSPHTPSE